MASDRKSQTLDAASVCEAALRLGLVSVRQMVAALDACRQDEASAAGAPGEAVLRYFLDRQWIRPADSERVRLLALEYRNAPQGIPTPVGRGSVRELADHLRIEELPSLSDTEERSAPARKSDDAEDSPPGEATMVERPTNRARRILHETRMGSASMAAELKEAVQSTQLLGSDVGPVLAAPAAAEADASGVDAEADGDELERAQAGLSDGRYRIRDRIGKGGMGFVYLARDLDLGRDVAMKTLPADKRGDEFMIRALIHEARITGQLQHPNIVPVYELGLHTSGRVFYTMKLLSDRNLQTVLHGLRSKEPRYEAEYSQLRLLNIFQRLCNALKYAHARGVVHRDVKPDNVLLGAYGEVQLMDWGIAALTERPDFSIFGEDTVVAGTPSYMAPEQADPLGPGPIPANDIYALGVILYEMLTLHLPCDVGAKVTDLTGLASVKSKPIVPPHERAPDRGIAPALSVICLRALSFEPGDRYADAGALWSEIEDHLEGSKEQERLRTRAEREVEWGRAAATRYRHALNERRSAVEAIAESERRQSPWEPFTKRRALWDRRNRVAALDVVLGESFAEAVMYLQRAMGNDPQSPIATRELAELYASRGAFALEAGDQASAVYFYGRQRELWPSEMQKTQGTLSVRSTPPGVEVFLFRSEELASPPTYDDAHRLGQTPLLGTSLEPGSYLLVGREAGYRDMHRIVTIHPAVHESTVFLMEDWGSEVPLVGRADELTRLRINCEQLRDNRGLRSVLIRGDSGSGKGRLLQAFSNYVEGLPEAFLYFFVHSEPACRWVPFSTLVGLLRHRMGVVPGAAPELVTERLNDLIAFASFGKQSEHHLTEEEWEEVRRRGAILSRMPGLGARAMGDSPVPNVQLTRALISETTALFADIAARFPLIVVLRAVHHSDAASAAFLGHALSALREQPILILATTGGRVDKERAKRWVSFSEQMTVRPLRPEAVSQLLREVLRAPVGDELVAAIHRHTGGHGHAVEETVRWLVQSGLVERVRGVYQLRPTARQALKGQYDLRTRLELRVQQLGGHVQRALEAAAVLGSVFSASALAAMGISEPDWAIGEMLKADFLVRENRATLVDEVEYRFRNTDEQAALVDLVDPERVQLLHEAAAAWVRLEREKFDTDTAESAGLLWVAREAHHRSVAGQGGLVGQLHLELGDVAYRIGSWEDAARNYRHAAVSSHDNRTRASGWIGRVRALAKLNQPSEITRALHALTTVRHSAEAADLMALQLELAKLSDAEVQEAMAAVVA